MRQVLDTVWQRRGTSWLWDEEARNTVCAADEVWSLRQILQAAAPGAQGWPDDLPRNGGHTLVVAGLGAMLLPVWRAPLALLVFLITGGLFASIGQTYQTGADPWQLFALWAALGLPLA